MSVGEDDEGESSSPTQPSPVISLSVSSSGNSHYLVVVMVERSTARYESGNRLLLDPGLTYTVPHTASQLFMASWENGTGSGTAPCQLPASPAQVKTVFLWVLFQGQSTVPTMENPVTPRDVLGHTSQESLAGALRGYPAPCLSVRQGYHAGMALDGFVQSQ